MLPGMILAWIDEDRGRGHGFGVIIDGTTNAYKKVKLERLPDKKVKRVTKKCYKVT